MIVISNRDFNIGQIAESGQCFRINQIDDYLWNVVAFDKILTIKQISNEITFYCNEYDFKTIWTSYFDLNTDYSDIKKFLLNLNDCYLTEAIKYGYGIRILKQDLWETMISFIISQRNNIKKIKLSIEKLCQYKIHFPSPQEINSYSFEFLSSCGFGYRTNYIQNLTKSIVNKKFNLNALKTMNYESSIEKLLTIKGIGNKIANCVMLYGLHHVNAFPIDTWMKKIISKHYKKDFNYKKFYPYCGIAQQYMFFYERKKSTK